MCVNAHGMDFRVGSVASTIVSFRFVDAEGTIKKISRADDPILFNAIIGGYGLFGVIADVDIAVTDNVMYEGAREIISYRDLPAFFETVIAPDQLYDLFYAHLSTEPRTFLKEAIVYTFKKAPEYKGVIPSLKEVERVNIRRFIFNLSKPSYFGKKIKWFAEKYLDTETQLKKCTLPTKDADEHACLISRNAAMHDAVEYVSNKLRNEVDILQEYFVPYGILSLSLMIYELH